LSILMLSLTSGYTPENKYKLYKELLSKTAFVKRIHAIFYVLIIVLFFIGGFILSILTISFN